jgi:hypothetical protein
LILIASSAGVFISSISVKNAFVADRFRAGQQTLGPSSPQEAAAVAPEEEAGGGVGPIRLVLLSCEVYLKL